MTDQTASQTETAAPRAPLSERFGKWVPYLLVPVFLILGYLLIGSGPTWATLTLAGLAMGMMIFVMASGLTLVFGLMDILNFGHGAFISIGAFVGATVLLSAGGWTGADSVLLNLGAVLPAMLAAMMVAGGLGYVFERVIVRPVYGAHLKQILVTMGGLIVAEELIRLIWGPDAIPLPRPEAFTGAWIFGMVAIEKYRVYSVILGLIIFLALLWVLGRTRTGLLIRAGVENGEMVEALGYRIRLIFILVFVAGSALAGLGGVMWGLYEQIITAQMGLDVLVLVFIVVIIGGLGSVHGCFIGALLVGLLANYTGYLMPKLALGSNILLMVAVLMWRPQGLLPINKQ
ncbi:MAG: branched-chain amino acid ABC transporter permease [Pseudomonadota bacterium]|uniref:branched-chain amino acid ABC transporter permease n=1 Tax=Fodinicurvata fenggangensis TaxID=1121830 RepID=UPI0009DE305B|nr:branched-chain amino acid ABC transporter permease [Fodinicurvata fenggangensis]